MDIELGCWLQLNKIEKIIDKHNKNGDLYLNNDKKHNDFVNKYYYEILPIFYYAKKCEATEVFFVDDNKPNNSFDGKFKVKDCIINIECTKSVNENNAEIQRYCNKNCFLYSYSVSLSKENFIKNVMMIVQNSILNKINEGRSKNKYKDFHLIVTLDDICFSFCSYSEFEIGITKYLFIDDITPFKKILFYKNMATGYPVFIKEIGAK